MSEQGKKVFLCVIRARIAETIVKPLHTVTAENEELARTKAAMLFAQGTTMGEANLEDLEVLVRPF